MNIDDVCTGFPSAFHTQVRDPSIEMKVFSPRYLQALQHFSCQWSMRPGITCVAHIARPGRPYSWPMINVEGWPPTTWFVATILKERAQAAMGPLGHSEMR